MFVFLIRLAIMIAAMYSTAIVTYVCSTMLTEYKLAHPEYAPVKKSLREMAGTIALCVFVLGFPVLNVLFANFCFKHYSELKDAIFAKLEAGTI